MAIIANTSGMNSDSNTHDNGIPSHAHDVFMDRQLQNKLLQADEDVEVEAYESKLSKPGNNVTNVKSSVSANKLNRTDPHAEDITGWFPNSKFVARRVNDSGAKTDHQNAKSTKDTFIHPWKDHRSKRDESFNFKHYNEPKKYIEQYRRDHGCLNNRYTSGNQIGEMRRIAFQTSAPSQPQSQNAVQVSLQQIQQGSSNGSSYQAGLQYTNRKDQLGTLQVMQGPSAAICSCKTGHTDSPNHNHRYKMSHTPGHILRTNTDIRGALHGEHSDNSSESGDHIHPRTPTRRISSATSSRSNQRPGKTPTKITVPANPRAYPLHALTIAWRIQQQLRQQNGKQEVHAQSKPLDNLNIVAPEKQPFIVEKKPIEPLGVSLRVQSLHDILATQETPMRGYALPKSTPPNPVSKNEPMDPMSSDSDTNAETQMQTPDVSIDQLSTCALHANKHGSRQTPRSSEILQMFLQDPVLSRLNQRPPLKEFSQENYKPIMALGTPKLFSPDAFLVPQNDVDAMLKVNMWNPIVSQTPVSIKKEVHSAGAQPYRTVMTQAPFRNQALNGQEVKPLTVHQMEGIGATTTMSERHDFFNPLKNIKLSITRVNNGVSFCRTHFQVDQTAGRKGLHSRGTPIGTLHVKGTMSVGENGKRNNKDTKPEVPEAKTSKVKAPLTKDHHNSVRKTQKGNVFEQKLNIPLPMVKIFESVPPSFIKTSKNPPDLQPMDNRAKTSSEQFRPVHGSARVNGRNSVHSDNTKGVTTSTIVKKVVPSLADNGKERSNSDLVTKPDQETQDSKLEVNNASLGADSDKLKLASLDDSTDNIKQTNKSSVEHEMERLNGIVKMFQTNRTVLEDTLKAKLADTKEVTKKREIQTESISVNKASKIVKKPAVASGEIFQRDPEFDGLTWPEKLEILRAVNKRPPKPKPKKPKLKYVTDNPTDDKIWSPEEEHVYEQRRIKHLLEQARVKGGKQYDWVHDAQMRARGIDWGTGKLKLPAGDSAGAKSDTSSEEVDCSDEEIKFKKYGISAPRKMSSSHLFEYQQGRRSKTFLLP